MIFFFFFCPFLPFSFFQHSLADFPSSFDIYASLLLRVLDSFFFPTFFHFSIFILMYYSGYL